MDTMSRYEDPDLRNETEDFAPDRLTVLRQIFDTVCEEAAIPPNALAERNDVANKLLQASATIKHEPLLMAVARKAVANYRR